MRRLSSQPSDENEAVHPIQRWLESVALIPNLAANYLAQHVGGAGSSSKP